MNARAICAKAAFAAWAYPLANLWIITMNRTDRLLAIVLELQGKGQRRAEDLAATFETSKRTIYRDMEALGQAGVPLVSVPGRGYTLMEGYFLPPINFTADEATTLLLGSAFVAGSFDAQYREAALAASRKIEGALPVGARLQVQELRQSLTLVGIGLHEQPDRAALLQQLRRAIIDRRSVQFTYYPKFGQDAVPEQTRTADPYHLMMLEGVWYLAAFCHLRQGMRNFRLDRLSELTVLERIFQRDQTLPSRRRLAHDEARITVRALFAPPIARWVREAGSFFQVAEDETPEGLLLTFRVRQESEITQWLLGWGRHVRVLEPPSLRQRLAEEIRAMLTNVGDD